MSYLDKAIERFAEDPRGVSTEEVKDLIVYFESENQTEIAKITFFVKSLFDLSLKGECSISIDDLVAFVYSNENLHGIFNDLDFEVISKRARQTETFRIIEWFQSLD